MITMDFAAAAATLWTARRVGECCILFVGCNNRLLHCWPLVFHVTSELTRKRIATMELYFNMVKATSYHQLVYPLNVSCTLIDDYRYLEWIE